MRRMHRIVLLTTLALVAPALAGCADFDLDKLDVFHLGDKKKLPGDRQPVFPEGVPGVTQGIPPEYMKGNQPPPETALAPPAAEAPQAAAPAEQAKPVAKTEEKPKPKTKKTAKRTKPKPKPAVAAPVRPVTQEAAPATANAPAPAPAPWPTPAQGQAAGTAAAPWPAAPPPGTFSR
jgi:outer membrane biosynthesis protein TonB